VDAAIAKGAAAALNTFSSDGSFMDSFRPQEDAATPANSTPSLSGEPLRLLGIGFRAPTGDRGGGGQRPGLHEV